MLTPNAVQAEIITQFAKSTGKGGILGLGVGTGKTLTGVEIARARGAKRVLIIAPGATLDGWYNHILWQTGQKLRRCANDGITLTITPDPAKRSETEQIKFSAAESKANMQACFDGEDGFFFVTREQFSNQCWDTVPVIINGVPVTDPKTGKTRTKKKRVDRWGRKRALDLVISDEHQKFAMKGNKGQQAYQWVNAKFKIPCSFDWYGSKIESMWTVSRDTFGTEVVSMNHAEWIDEHMVTKFNPHSYTKKDVVEEIWPGFWSSTLPLYVTAPPSVEPPEPEQYYVTLSREERKVYDALEENLAAMIEDGSLLVADNQLILRIRLRELSLAMVTPVEKDGKWTIEYRPGAKSSKLDAIKEILGDHPNEKFIIYTHSARWSRWAAEELGHIAESWNGQTSTTERDRIKSDFIDGNLRVIVAVIEAAGAGIDGWQRACRSVIFASRSDQSLMNHQAAGRIARQGQERPVQIWDVVARGTYDSGQLSHLIQKAIIMAQAKGL